MTSTASIRRQPSGTPVGGQFATSSRPAPAVTLDNEVWGGDDQEAAWAEVHEFARRAANRGVFRGAVFHTPEDIAQETVFSLLKRDADVKVMPGLVHSIVRGQTARALTAEKLGLGDASRTSSSDMQAWREWRSRVVEIEQATGRPLAEAAAARVAADIRANWPDPRHRPTADFHIGRRLVAMGEQSTVDSSHTASSEDTYMQLDSETEGDYMAAAFDVLESDDNDRRNLAAERLAYNAMAESCGAPLAKAGQMSTRQCTNARQKVGVTSESVLAAAEAWAEGEDSARTDLLFRPYGPITNAEKTEVVDLYRQVPEYAGDLYRSALLFSNTRYRDAAVVGSGA